MDPFALYGDLYKNLREAVSGAMYDGQVDTLKEATQVFRCCLRSSAGYAIYNNADIEILRGTIFLAGNISKGHPQ